MKSAVQKDSLNLLNSFKMRQFVALGMALILSFATVGCGGGVPLEQPQAKSSTTNQTRQVSQGNSVIADGKYTVQQANYNDGDGVYTLFLINTPPGTSATFRTDNLQMAQLTPEEVSAAQPAYLQVKDKQAAFHIPKEFKLEYVHNVVEQAQNPQTGQVEPRIIRQESNFWSPFAGALAGQVVGNLLFRPQYYVPPMYQSGGGLFGYGGYGNSYQQATSLYRQRYNNPPIAERNRTVYRSTRRTPSLTTPSRSNSSANQRSSGSGFGSSNLRPSPSSGSYRRSPSSSSFGSGRSSSSGSRSFSGGRRR
jgi:predicted small lipoprotein YifL